MTRLDPARWQDTLDRLCRKHSVPGASLAVLAGGEVYAVASGVVNAGTGVETTVDSVFQVGSTAGWLSPCSPTPTPTRCTWSCTPSCWPRFADLAVPRFTVPTDPPAVDIAPWVGTYRNLTREAVIESRDGEPWATLRLRSEFLDAPVTQHIRLTPVTETLFADPANRYPRTWTFRHLPDGTRFLHLGGRLLPRVQGGLAS